MAQQIKPSKALVIIDMQPYFYSSSAIISEVVDLVKLAKQENKRILIVEYDIPGTTSLTFEDITNEVKEYKKVRWVKKKSNDGSNEVLRTLGPRPVELDICGVNLNGCVQATVAGLLGNGSIRKINLFAKATNDAWKTDDPFNWFIKQKKVKIIK